MARVLIYSHDSFGLGHIRRCLAIASALTAEFADTTVRILSGSPLIGRFDLPERVECAAVPGVLKQVNGDYVSRDSAEPLDETIRARATHHPPDRRKFRSRPLPGRQGTPRSSGRGRGDPAFPESARLPARARPSRHSGRARTSRRGMAAQDRPWPRSRFSMTRSGSSVSPRSGIRSQVSRLSAPSRAKMRFTGYLDRRISMTTASKSSRMLVTPGGGGDGVGLVDWVLSRL